VSSDPEELEQRVAEAMAISDRMALEDWVGIYEERARAVIPLVREAVLAEVSALIERDFPCSCSGAYRKIDRNDPFCDFHDLIRSVASLRKDTP
jgi:hypothetical protein